MIKKIVDFCAGLPMTVLGGVFLLASFVLPRMGFPWGEALAWGCVAVCGTPLLYLALRRLAVNQGIAKISSALLISIAMIAAILIGDLFAAGEVAFIMELGALLEDATVNRAKKGLKSLLSITPQKARRVRGTDVEIVETAQIVPGDVVRVLPGEAIPADGTIVCGETSVDQSVVTGESLPVDKRPGDEVFCGTINRFGSVDITVTKTGEDSSLQKLVRLVAEAESRQAPAQRIADRWASWLVPVALLIAVAVYVVTGEVVRAVTVLVVFCPCALVLATPTAVVAAVGQAAKHGVIVKSGEALEKIGKAGIMAFDKTGTLTTGELEVCDVIPLTELGEDELLSIGASVESRSEHPLGAAIVRAGRERRLPLREAQQFRMFAGKGVTALVDGERYFCGGERFLEENGIVPDAAGKDALSKLHDSGKAPVAVADGQRVLGIIALSDTVRPDAAEAVKRLAKMGVRSVLLTGDNRRAADFFAQSAGISEVRAELLPEEKVEHVIRLKQSGCVCMIGDGVNDAPALKAADAGIAMGAFGSELAVEAADAALMTDDLMKLPYLKWLARETVKTIRLAISLSMGINAVAVSLSAAGVLTPTAGALVHNAGSCFVVLLAALLYDRKYRG